MRNHRDFDRLKPMTGIGLAMVMATGLGFGLSAPASAQTATAERPACDADNGGLTLADGLCALVVADELGRARHLSVSETGDIYVILREARDGHPLVALRDTDGDGRMDIVERFGDFDGGTGIGIRNGHLYVGPNDRIMRYALTEGELVPASEPEIVVAGFPQQRSHAVKPFAFDGDGNIHVNVGGPSNACQVEDRTAGSPGQDPCPQLERQAGIWRFDADRAGQDAAEDGERYATGIRNSVALAWNNQADALYVVQHGRDQLDQWPAFTAEQNADLPAEEFLRVAQGADFGWPYCYFDQTQDRRVLAPEYGGDGHEVGRCDQFERPIGVFPAHWAPNGLIFYTGDQLGERYRNGAFIAFHGSWNREPFEQRGYKVVFQPMRDGQPDGEWEVFADGFAGTETVMTRDDAEYRPMGLAQGPDGSLYVSDSVEGRIWRILASRAETATD